MIEWTVTDRVQHLGYELPNNSTLTKIGKRSKFLFKQTYGERKQLIRKPMPLGEVTYHVYHYNNTDVQFIDRAIHEILGPLT